MKKLSELLTKDLGWKFISLLLAIGLWFIVVNMTNPMDTQYFSRSLVILNKEEIQANNYVLVNEPDLLNTRVDMRVRGSSSDITMLKNAVNKNANLFRAYIDLKPIDYSRSVKIGERQQITVKYDFTGILNSSHYEILSMNPVTVDIILDKYITKQFPISVNRIGEAKEGFVSLQPVVEQTNVSISGANLLLDTIDSVRTEVDLTNAAADVNKKGALMVIDKNGNDITNKVTLSFKDVSITVPVKMQAKIPIAAPTVTGNLPDGYRISSISIEPEFVEVIGDAKDVESLKAIELTSINIDNVSTNIEKTFDLREYLLETNVSIKNGAQHEAKVKITIEKEAVKDIAIPVANLIIKGDASYELSSEEVHLVVRGSHNEINKLDPTKITGYIDLTNAQPGEQEATVNFTLPSGIMQIGQPTKINVTITDPSQTESNQDPAGNDEGEQEPENTPLPGIVVDQAEE